jgi:predicted enzyme related to lactoylglutathione lyase
MRIVRFVTLFVAVASAALSGQNAGVSYRPQATLQFSVANLDRAIEFYTKVLEYKLTERRDDLKFAHIATNVPGLELGLGEVAEPKGTTGVILNVSVTDVAAARKLLESRGVKFKGETLVIPGKVALAGFSDPDGNSLRLAGPPPKQ